MSKSGPRLLRGRSRLRGGGRLKKGSGWCCGRGRDAVSDGLGREQSRHEAPYHLFLDLDAIEIIYVACPVCCLPNYDDAAGAARSKFTSRILEDGMVWRGLVKGRKRIGC